VDGNGTKMNKYIPNSIIIYIFLSAITVAAFWGVQRYEFVNLDDPQYISGNQNIQRGFSAETIKWAFTSTEAANWHPLTWLSHAFDCSLFGLNPGAHHSVSLLIHLINVLLLYAILRKSTGAVWQSAFVACLFAIHPLRIESVAWVSERKDVLSATFWMLAIIAYIQYCRRPGACRYGTMLILFVLGLMSKPMLVTFPFVLLLMDYWPLERFEINLKKRSHDSKSGKTGAAKHTIYFLIAEKSPLFILTAISCAITYIVQQKGGAMDMENRFSLSSRIANSFLSYLFYIRKTVWPTALSPFYPHPGEHISYIYAFLSAGMLLALTYLAFRFGKLYKYIPVGWLWFLAMLAPVIGLIQVGGQAYADRYSYLPITGLFIIAAWLIPQLISKWRYKYLTLAIASAAVIAALSLSTYFQKQYWHDSIALFEHAIRVTKDNYIAHFCIAEPLRLKGRLQEAMYHDTECLKIRPNHCEALNSLGLVLMDSGRFDDALSCFEKATKISPNLFPSFVNMGMALIKKGKNDEAIALYRDLLQKYDLPQIHSNLATALRYKGNTAAAIREFNQVLASEPSNAIVHYTVGVLLAEQGRNSEAAEHFQKVLEIEPDSIQAHNSLGYILAHQGQYEQAIHHYNEALRIAPDAVELHINLGFVYVSQGKLDLAAAEYNKALKIQPDNYVAHTYLGTVLVNLGKTAEGIEHFNNALKIKPDYALARNNLNMVKSILHQQP
jgi:protein O-mannosyl-transferase